MRKVLFLVIAFFICIPMWGIRIIKDLNLTNLRQIQTSYELFTDNYSYLYSMSLCMTAQGVDTTYEIFFTIDNKTPFAYPKGMIMTMKLKSGKVIARYTTKDISEGENTQMQKGDEIYYRVYSSYKFTRGEIEELFNVGVSTMRIQTIYDNNPYLQFPGRNTCSESTFMFNETLRKMFQQIYNRLHDVPIQESLLIGM